MTTGANVVTVAEFDAQGPSGRELDSAESASVQSGIGATAVDLTGMSITFDVTDRPVYVELDVPVLAGVTAAVVANAQITDNAGTIKRAIAQTIAAASYAPVRVVERIAPTGTTVSYTRKAQVKRFSGTGTITVNVDATTVATLVAVER